jgi:hypothetical protein
MFTTPNMGLTAWDLGADSYDHSQLATNFNLLDLHNHTTGKGLQIPTEGIASAAITSTKIATDAVVPTTHIPVDSIPQSRLAPDSVGNSELQDGSVTGPIIVDGSITSAKLDPTILPVGMVIMWHRADASVLPPTGWEVMDGRAWSTITNKMGAGGVQWNTGNIPNMSNKFPLGSALAGTGTLPSQPPGIGGVGGQHERDLTHAHTTQPHTHVVDPHVHGISADGAHSHRYVAQTTGGPSFTDAFTRDVGVPRAEGTRQALYVPGHNSGSFLGSNVVTPLETIAAHSHTGATGTSSPSTSASTTTVNSGLTGNQDLRPAHVGLLFIMKVR